MVSAARRNQVANRHAYNKLQNKSQMQIIANGEPRFDKFPKKWLEMACNAPLHLAAIQKDPNTIQELIDGGCDVNRLDAEKRTPLMLAALFGRRDNVDCLLANDASQIKKDAFGQKALDYTHPCKCNEKKREIYDWNLLDLTNIALECRMVLSMFKGNQKIHICPARPDNFPEYYAVRSSKHVFTIMAPVFQVIVNNADTRTIAWTLSKGTLDVNASAVSGWSYTKYKNPPECLLDSEEWTDKVGILSKLVGHDLHGSLRDLGEYGRMFSSHAEKQIIAFIAWNFVLDPRAWKKWKKHDNEEQIEIFVSRRPCRWCDDLCTKTNDFFGTKIKLVFIHRVQNLADRCKCGGCMCELPTPQVIIPMLGDLDLESDPPETPSKIPQPAVRSQRKVEEFSSKKVESIPLDIKSRSREAIESEPISISSDLDTEIEDDWIAVNPESTTKPSSRLDKSNTSKSINPFTSLAVSLIPPKTPRRKFSYEIPTPPSSRTKSRKANYDDCDSESEYKPSNSLKRKPKSVANSSGTSGKAQKRQRTSEPAAKESSQKNKNSYQTPPSSLQRNAPSNLGSFSKYVYDRTPPRPVPSTPIIETSTSLVRMATPVKPTPLNSTPLKSILKTTTPRKTLPATPSTVSKLTSTTVKSKIPSATSMHSSSVATTSSSKSKKPKGRPPKSKAKQSKLWLNSALDELAMGT